MRGSLVFSSVILLGAVASVFIFYPLEVGFVCSALAIAAWLNGAGWALETTTRRWKESE